MNIPLQPLTLFLTFALSAISAHGKESTAIHLSEIAPAYAATSVNTAIFRTAAVASRDSVQYACFYNPEGRLTLASRTLGSDDWTVAPTQYTGNVSDAHNVASLGIDGDGYLHVSFDHHGHPLRYCRSGAPGSLQLGDFEPMTVVKGEDNVTYPEFYNLPGGDLLFVFRSGASGRGDMVLNRYDRATRSWSRLHDVLIDGEGRRNAYWQMCVDPQGWIHVSWVWRETWKVETNHDLCYARSRDGGLTWERSDGTPYSLPITMESAEVAVHIPQGSELINQCSMDADGEGNPVIAMYWREAPDSVPHFRTVELTPAGWHSEIAVRRSTPFTLSGGGTKMIPVSRPRIAVGLDGRAVMLFRDAERGSCVSMAVRERRGAAWRVSDLTPFSVDAWEPSVDLPLWRESGRLHVYTQRAGQGDGERTTSTPPQPASILEISTF